MLTFSSLWWRRSSQELLEHRQAIAEIYRRRHAEARRLWRARSEIEDLSDPYGKRFLFDPETKTPW
jgi:hypothetical protein